MKKLISVAMALVLTAGMLTGCGNSSNGSNNSTTGANGGNAASSQYEIALVTDVGNIDDKSFNQGSWEGVVQYAQSSSKTYNYYRPSEDSDEARIETMKTAINNGAKVIVCPGYLFEVAIFDLQGQYPDVQFLLLDGEPHSADYATYKTESNVHCILYKEEQAGYFAGYAAVKEGFTQLGFLGGMDVPAVVRYGFGFVQGADAAAKEMGVDVNVKYWYSGSFGPLDDIMTKMSGWYTEGTQVVFACGGGIYLSALKAADAVNGKVIGVDVDQAAESELIITSAMKELTTSVVLALTDLYSSGGKWPTELAGVTSTLGAAENCVGLPTAEGSWRLKNYTVDEYKTLFENVKSGAAAVSNSLDKPTVSIKVDYQN